MASKDRQNPPPSKSGWNPKAMLAMLAILGLAGYFVFTDRDELAVKPATGTAQAMSAAASK